MTQISEHYQQNNKIPCFLYPAIDFTRSLPSHHIYAQGFNINAQTLAWCYKHYLPQEQDVNDLKYSVLYSRSFENFPPGLIITAEHDPLRDEGEMYAKKLNHSKIPAVLKRFDGMIHGFISLPRMTKESYLAVDYIAQTVNKFFY